MKRSPSSDGFLSIKEEESCTEDSITSLRVINALREEKTEIDAELIGDRIFCRGWERAPGKRRIRFRVTQVTKILS